MNSVERLIVGSFLECIALSALVVVGASLAVQTGFGWIWLAVRWILCGIWLLLAAITMLRATVAYEKDEQIRVWTSHVYFVLALGIFYVACKPLESFTSAIASFLAPFLG